ncbi:MAG TPA: CDC27 family protein [Cyclobacteriaceae bacterium]|nr:CDC27 family protein [Cyclobacteriaceae bacterium]
MKGPKVLGDEAFAERDYRNAVTFYETSNNPEVLGNLAQCFYFLKDYRRCVDTMDAIVKRGQTLKSYELLNYAEAQSAMGNYSVAINYYKRYLEGDPDNELILKKIWALSNINFLHEDSAHYSVKLLKEAHSLASEMGPALLSNGLVFTSNRKGTRPAEIATDGAAGSFYELYIIEWKVDSVTKTKIYSKPSRFAKSLGMTYNVGPVAFYNSRKKMVFVASSQQRADDGSQSLGLYFAELHNSRWKITTAWPYNSPGYSVTGVTINEDGTQLYFSSNMKGGAGGKDIYTSVLKDGRWSKPANPGELINTKGDEVFPYLHRNGTLYFSSDGLPGIGGLDIFRTTIKANGYSEPENVGYPINSHGDDFSLTFDSLATHGYFSSNRSNGGFDDDIYEFDMDFQTYPFQMAGLLKYKEHTWSDTLDIHTWGNMKLTLIDTWQNTEIQQTTSRPDGTFTFTIPYFSRYHIIVTDESGRAHKASLELEKYRTEGHQYEIVVVKEMFAELKEP